MKSANVRENLKKLRSWSEALETSRVQLHLLSWPQSVSKCVWTTLWATAISTKHWCKTELGRETSWKLRKKTFKFQQTQQYQLNFAWKKAIRVRCRLLLPSLEHTEKVGTARRRCKRLLLPFQAMKEALETPGKLEIHVRHETKTYYSILIISYDHFPSLRHDLYAGPQKETVSLWPWPKCLQKRIFRSSRPSQNQISFW